MYETRKRIIFDLLQQKGSVKVVELMELLSMSDMTIRRDIKSMADEGLLRKVHGGAVALKHEYDDIPFATRQIEELERKKAIARYATTILEGGESIYIDGSTTCGELAKLLNPSKNFTVITDSLYVLLELSKNRNIELLLLGGVLDKDGNTFDGILTVDNAKKVMVDYCFFSAKGFSENYIGNNAMTGSQVKQLMIHNSHRCFLLADSTKYRKPGIIKLCTWQDVEVLISDDGLNGDAAEKIKGNNTDVFIAPLE